MNKREITSIVILIAVIGFGIFRFITREYTETKSRYMLDTILEISASSKQKNVGKKIESVYDYIATLEKKLNEYDENSLIFKINNSPETEFTIDEDFYRLLVISDSLFTLTNGGFDITIKPVFDLWHFDADTLAIPEDSQIKEKLSLVDFSKLRYSRDKLYKPQGMQITFGALAKGYILDQVKSFMLGIGLEKGFINCRSSISFWGASVPQLVYVQHPRKHDDYIASFRVKELSISTSGDYQQFYEYEGKRYHHILNAKTGYPVEDIHSLTVIHPSALWADALSTSLFVLPPELAANIVNKIRDCDAIIYYSINGSIVSLKTKGMAALDLDEKL